MIVTNNKLFPKLLGTNIIYQPCEEISKNLSNYVYKINYKIKK